jgi:hypothetical protein
VFRREPVVGFLALKPGHLYRRGFIDLKSAVLGWPEPHHPCGWVWWREAEPGPHTDDTLRVPQRAEQVLGQGLSLDLSGDGDDARSNLHTECVRIEGEFSGDDLLPHRIADLA